MRRAFVVLLAVVSLLVPGGAFAAGSTQPEEPPDVAVHSIDLAAMPMPAVPGKSVELAAQLAWSGHWKTSQVKFRWLMEGHTVCEKSVNKGASRTTCSAPVAADRKLPFTVTVIADPYGMVAETDEANNQAARSIPVTPMDLAVTESDLEYAPMVVRPGASVTLKAVIHNTMGWFARAAAPQVRLLVDGKLLAEKQFSGSDSPVFTISEGYTVPADRVDPIRFRVEIDPLRESPDADFTNNQAEITIPLLVHDLSIRSDDLGYQVRIRSEGKRSLDLKAVIQNASQTSLLTKEDVHIQFLIDGKVVAEPQLSGSGAASHAVTATWNLPPDQQQPLEYRVNIRTGNLHDSQPQNNTAYVTIPVSAWSGGQSTVAPASLVAPRSPTYPDIALTDASLFWTPREAVPGGKMKLGVRVRNLGTGHAGSRIVHLLAGGKVVCSQRTGQAGTDSGAGQTFTCNWTVPAGQAAPVQLEALVDPLAQAPDADRRNNRATGTIPLTKPDLAVAPGEIAATPALLLPARQATFRAIIRNDGGRTGADVPVRFRVDGQEIATVTVTIPAFGWKEAAATWNMPADQRGQVSVEVVADPGDVVNEASETNNAATTSVPIKDLPTEATVTVQVYDRAYSPVRPVAGTVVTVAAGGGTLTDMTDGDGLARIAHVPFGETAVSATHPGMATGVAAGATDCYSAAPYFTVYVDSTGVLTGTIRNQDSGQGLGGITVALQNGPGTQTDEHGAYRLYAPGGEYRLEVIGAGFTRHNRSVVVTGATSTNVDMLLQRTTWAEISGRVQLYDGTPVAGVIVTAAGDAGNSAPWFGSAETAADGTYTLWADLPWLRTTVSLRADKQGLPRPVVWLEAVQGGTVAAEALVMDTRVAREFRRDVVAIPYMTGETSFWGGYQVETAWGICGLKLFAKGHDDVLEEVGWETVPGPWWYARVSGSWSPLELLTNDAIPEEISAAADMAGAVSNAPGWSSFMSQGPVRFAIAKLVEGIPVAASGAGGATRATIERVAVYNEGTLIWSTDPGYAGDFTVAPTVAVDDWKHVTVRYYVRVDPGDDVTNVLVTHMASGEYLVGAGLVRFDWELSTGKMTEGHFQVHMTDSGPQIQDAP